MTETQFMPGATIHLYQNDLPEALDLGPVIAVDTETMGLKPHRDRLCLVQLSAGDGVAHLVQLLPASLGGRGFNAPNLARLLADPQTVKLMHFARFDVAILQHTFDIAVAPVKCTKIAARLTRTFTDRPAPGHELQFDSMVEQGVSLARVLYAFNSTNAEGWGLYSEYIMQPYEPADGQLLTLQLRLLRAARAFLDPELQSGATTPQRAYEVLEKDVVLSHAFATEEVERYTFRSPGQANSYFYGYTRLLALRQEVEKALGNKFDQKKFHDFILSQGLLPPDLMRKAVLEDFVPAQK